MKCNSVYLTPEQKRVILKACKKFKISMSWFIGTTATAGAIAALEGGKIPFPITPA